MKSTIHHTALHAPLACSRCGAIDRPSIQPGTAMHAFRAVCGHCGQFLRWLSQYTPAEREARRQAARAEAMARKPPSALQLSYLAALGDDPAAPPATMAEASQRIDTLRERRTR